MIFANPPRVAQTPLLLSTVARACTAPHFPELLGGRLASCYQMRPSPIVVAWSLLFAAAAAECAGEECDSDVGALLQAHVDRNRPDGYRYGHQDHSQNQSKYLQKYNDSHYPRYPQDNSNNNNNNN
eukprot:gb/GFBE01024055.1/.p1 GENE.gb/GFBE01024055.1/~~gb/GFBE01024055.1/.p1  ORF type:complete len:126 (+),score=11.46 gb/GFBE01024055.1/:1-378(+)